MTDTLSSAIDATHLGFDPERLARIDTHFAQYVDDGRLPGFQVAVTRRGELAHHSVYGKRNMADGLPWERDTIARLFSMTKPITSVAAMILLEQGKLSLKDPVAKFIPEFGATPVYRSGSFTAPVSEPQQNPMLVWHLLTHTAGLTYGFLNTHVTDELHRRAGFEWATPKDLDLAGCCAKWAEIPLVFQPGTEWNYGVSTDVLGRVIEVVSGQTLDRFFREHILDPLGMIDTEFWVPDEKQDRFAALYYPAPGDRTARLMPSAPQNKPPAMLAGGGGLCGTLDDYLRFCHMLLGGGQLDGVRILGSRTVDYMRQNHLPGNADLEEFGRPLFAETAFAGVGFGLGFSVVIDALAGKVPTSVGKYAWGGAASTAFWIDPLEEIVAVFLTQLLPSSTHPIRPELETLVQQALVD